MLHILNYETCKRKIALERMHVLISNAISNARLNPDLAQRQASLARRISTHYRIKMPYELRINFCKNVKILLLQELIQE